MTDTTTGEPVELDDIGAGAPADAASTRRRSRRPRPVEADRSERVFPTTGPRMVLQTLSVGLAGIIAALVEYQWWNADANLAYGARTGDGKLIMAMVKTISERGWYLTQPRLGYPFGQTFYDFPHGGETFQLAGMKALTTFVHDPATAINIYYFVGFGLVAAVTFLVLRHLRIPFVIAALASLSFDLLTYHHQRGEWHLWRSTYISVPLGVLLILWSQQWRERFLVDPDRPGRLPFRGNLRWRRVLAAAAIGVVIGGTETMSTAFTMLLLMSAALVASIRWREPARLLVAGALVLTIAGTFAVMSYPTLNYWRVYGPNKEAADRGVAESELYGMKLWSMVTPAPDHRIKALARIASPAVDDARVPSEIGQNLGLLATAGFFGALYGALAGGIGMTVGRRNGRGDPRPAKDRTAIRETASVVILVSILVGAIGGLSVLLALGGLTQVRVWNRLLIFIALFSLLIVCTWAERFDRWLRGRHRATLLRSGMALLMLVVVLGDTIKLTPNYPAYKRDWANDQHFVDAIERTVPAGTGIFQLPVIPFPEAVVPGDMMDYDPLIGYLHDHGTLRWSYGAIRGRQTADWQIYLRDHVGPVGALPSLLGLGYTGLWVDTAGYTDGGKEVRQIEQVVGVKPLRSARGRFLFYDLRPYKKRLAVSDADLRKEAKRLLHIAPPT
ncbi:MAG: hypothetical protein JWM05_2940 [Acidimicrobiales bacterium]|nr:hypothetical protein [Acidimicrobiales bacterium]